ncbi:hypothetical protein MHU86_24743 [Fragilaria crotonensis]|nr:hypothetical protein MHU86_24743 [Fragilaria crotonensis]
MDNTSLLQSYPSDKAASILERQNELNQLLPPLKIGEYDTVVESIAGRGLGLHLKVKEGIIAFCGYKKFEDGFKCPAELNKSVHAVGDVFIAVDGVSLDGLSFRDAFAALQASVGEGNKFVFLRFRENATASSSNISTPASVVQPLSADTGSTTVIQPPTILDKAEQPHREVVSSTEAKSHDGSASPAIPPSRMPPKSRTMVWYGHTRIPYPGIAQRLQAMEEAFAEENAPPTSSQENASVESASVSEIGKHQQLQAGSGETGIAPQRSVYRAPSVVEPATFASNHPASSSQENASVESASVSEIGIHQQLQAGSGETGIAPQRSVYRAPSVVEPATFASNHPASSQSAGTSFGTNRSETNFMGTPTEQSTAMRTNEKQDSLSGSEQQLPQNVYHQPSVNSMGNATASNDMTNVADNSNHEAGPVTTSTTNESHSTPRNAVTLQAKQPALPTKSSSVQQVPSQQSNFGSVNSSFQSLGNCANIAESSSMEPMLMKEGNVSSALSTNALQLTNSNEPLPPSDSFTADTSVDHFPRKRLFAFKSVLQGDVRSMNASSIVSCRVLEAKGEEGYKPLHLKRAAIAYATPLNDIDELMEAKQQHTTRNRNGGRGQKRSAEAHTSPHASTSPKKQSNPRSLMGRAPTLVYEGPPLKSLFGGWPDGWIQKTYQRQGSTSRDSYFYGPGTDHRFRSLIEVLRFLGR